MNVSDKAVEAAARAMFEVGLLGFSWDELDAETQERFMDLATVALEAAVSA